LQNSAILLNVAHGSLHEPLYFVSVDLGTHHRLSRARWKAIVKRAHQRVNQGGFREGRSLYKAALSSCLSKRLAPTPPHFG